MSDKVIHIQPWADPRALSEGAVRRVMQVEGLYPARWCGSSGNMYHIEGLPYQKIIYIMQGTLRFELIESGKQFRLQPGDRLELPPGLKHRAVAGRQGFICLEAYAQQSRLNRRG